MSDISSTTYGRDNKNDNGISPILLILLLSMCGGDNGLFGGLGGSNECGCNSGLGSMLPIILLLTLGGGSIF
jgi:hypothetical protein